MARLDLNEFQMAGKLISFKAFLALRFSSMGKNMMGRAIRSNE